jgi:exosortase
MSGVALIQARRQPMRTIVPLAALLIATAAFVAPAVAHAVDLWSTTDEFSYGFLIVPISVALVVTRRSGLRHLDGSGNVAGLFVAVIAVVAFAIAERVGINAIAGLAVSPLLWGMTGYLFGRRAARELAFPIAFLAFGLAPYRGLLDNVGFALQVVTAHGAGALSGLARLPVTLDGLVLQLPGFGFIVAEACSGMSSLLSLLALSSLWIYLADARPPARVAVILSVLPIVIAANVVRVTLVLGVAFYLGPDTAIGFFHGASSAVLFGVALASLMAFSWVVGCRLRLER